MDNANDPIEKYDLDAYQPIHSKPQLHMKRRSGGLAFYLKNSIRFEPISFESKIECEIIKIQI